MKEGGDHRDRQSETSGAGNAAPIAAFGWTIALASQELENLEDVVFIVGAPNDNQTRPTISA
jgi:hypothetical protein